MPRRNGSYFGLTVNPTHSVASGIWRVREAEEFLRVNKWPATPGVPGSPVGSAGNAQVSLTWSAPTLGTPPTDYQVQYSSNSGSTWTTFADGTSDATSAVVTGLTNGTGYIFRVRAVNALGEGPYGAASGTVTPSSIDVALLLHFDGSNGSTTFTDSSPNGLTVTASGNAAISTAQVKYGTGSLSLDGFGSHATIDSTSALGLGVGDFTIEAWIWVNSLSIGNTIVDLGGYQNGMLLRLAGGSNDAAYIAGTSINWNSGNFVTAQQWTHVAMTRQGGTVRFFVGGTQVYATTNSNDAGESAAAMIGQASHSVNDQWNGPQDAFNGYIDELRIVKGTALYTANFTPPTAPF
jgi:hypothetical protein